MSEMFKGIPVEEAMDFSTMSDVFEDATVINEASSLPFEPQAETDDAARADEHDPDKVFSYTLKDGREFSGTRKEAMEKCPVFQEMTEEEANETLEDQEFIDGLIATRKAQLEAEKANTQQKVASETDDKIAGESKKESDAKTEPVLADEARTTATADAVADNLSRQSEIQDSIAMKEKPYEPIAAVIDQHEPTVQHDDEDLRHSSNEDIVFLHEMQRQQEVQESEADPQQDSALEEAGVKKEHIEHTVVTTKEKTDDNHLEQPEATIYIPPAKLFKELEDAPKQTAASRQTSEREPPVPPPIRVIAPREEIIREVQPTVIEQIEEAPVLSLMSEQESTEPEPTMNDVMEVIEVDEFEQPVTEAFNTLWTEVEEEYPGVQEDFIESVMTKQVPVVQELEVMPMTEISEETAEFYSELLALAEADVRLTEINAEEPYWLIEDEGVSIESAALETSSASATREYFTDQIETVEVADFEIIVTEAPEQTLEQTFVQLAAYFNESTEGPQDTEEYEMDQTVHEHVVKRLLSELDLEFRLHTENNEEQKQLQITPEITQKLFELLREIGYENPQETLRVFVKDHSVEFLLQTIRYLHQLTDEDNQREMKSFKIPQLSGVSSDNSISVRLGRAMMGLLRMRSNAPQTT